MGVYHVPISYYHGMGSTPYTPNTPNTLCREYHGMYQYYYMQYHGVCIRGMGSTQYGGMEGM
jgi:hypothetical protein